MKNLWQTIKDIGFKITIKANWQQNDDGSWWFVIYLLGFKIYEHGKKDA